MEKTTTLLPVDLIYKKSDVMAADLHTKAFTNQDKWRQVCDLIAVVDPKRIRELTTNRKNIFADEPEADAETTATEHDE